MDLGLHAIAERLVDALMLLHARPSLKLCTDNDSVEVMAVAADFDVLARHALLNVVFDLFRRNHACPREQGMGINVGIDGQGIQGAGVGLVRQCRSLQPLATIQKAPNNKAARVAATNPPEIQGETSDMPKNP